MNEVRLECIHTGIGTDDLVRHKDDNRLGKVVSIYAVSNVRDCLVDDLLFGTSKTYFREPSTVLAKVEFLMGWIWNGHPVIVYYHEDLPTFLLNKEECKVCGRGICKCKKKYAGTT